MVGGKVDYESGFSLTGAVDYAKVIMDYQKESRFKLYRHLLFSTLLFVNDRVNIHSHVNFACRNHSFTDLKKKLKNQSVN